MTESTSSEESDLADRETPPPDPAARLPFLVQLTAALLIFGGIYSLWEVIPGRDDAFNLFNLVFCVVGFGLLRRNRTAWGCTALLLGVIVVATLVGLFGAVIPAFQPPVGINFDSPLADVAGVAVTLAVTGALLYALTRREVIASFNSDLANPQAGDATRWGWIILILGAFAAAGFYFAEKSNETLLEGTFAVDTTYQIFDARTDEPIEGIRIRGPGIPMGVGSARLSTTAGASSSAMRHHGFAHFPFEVTVDADGYEGVTLTIDEDTPAELRFSLQKTAEEPRAEPD